MDPNLLENNFNTSSMGALNVLPNMAAFKLASQQQQQQQQQQQKQQLYALNAAQSNGLSTDYIDCSKSSTGGDTNSNNNNFFGNYGTSLNYLCDGNLISNNNNNINFPNQNYKAFSKYATGSNVFSLSMSEQNFTGINANSATSIAHSTPCQYAYTYGGTSCFNRNRYMPYNHNRTCAAAAAAAAATSNISMAIGARTTVAPLMGTSKVSGIMPSNSAPPLIYTSYQQPIRQFPCFTPLSSQSASLETASSSLIPVTYSQSIANNFPEYINYPLNVQSSIGATTIGNESLSSGNIQPSLAYSIAPTSSNSTENSVNCSTVNSAPYTIVTDISQTISLRLSNLDYTMDEESLRKFLLAQLKPITPVISLTFEDINFATLTVPDSYFAKQVVANLHRKKIGHKRMVVSYTRDSSQTEINTLRCQVAGLLKDVPYNRLPMYKFRELFQSRFKISISVLDLYTMRDICIINTDGNDEKYITLQPNLVNSLEISPLMEGTQHTVPYCIEHFKREQHKGWAEQEIEQLPNVFMTISEIQNIIYPLLKTHQGDIPISTLLHCIEGVMSIKIKPNDNGVNLEHLVCCVQGVKVQLNNFGIKIVNWFDTERRNSAASMISSASSNSSTNERGLYFKSADPLSQITREVIELVKMSPKSTMKFSRFIPAYHNHFGKQCRVADYGYTKLIELFEALSAVVQIMGDGENRLITLTHRTQIRRFTSDLLRILRCTGNKSILLSALPKLFSEAQHRTFNVSDYGVCSLRDIIDGLVNSNVVVVSKVQNGKDILISIPKRQQTQNEVNKTSIFAAEIVELFQNASQYTILFQKFVRSFHYHFGYQCRLSDYGFLKLADLMEAIQGLVEMDRNNDEDRRIFLSPQIGRRVFAEQCEELIRTTTGSSKTAIKLEQLLKLHKKKFGYQIQSESLGVKKLSKAIELLPYVEVFEENGDTWLICHNDDPIFRTLCYRACKHLMAYDPIKYQSSLNAKPTNENVQSNENKKKPPSLDDFIIEFNAKYKENLNVKMVKAMRYAIEIYNEESNQCVRISKFMDFVVKIVRLLEQQTMLLLSDIKSTMNCALNTTFPFGFPNLFTLLKAYPDIFIVNLGVTQESSEIRLANNCELVTMQRNFGNNQKNANNVLKPVQPKSNLPRLVRPPLAECNGHNLNSVYTGPPMTKIRHIMPSECNTELTDWKTHNISNINSNNTSNNNNYCQPTNTALISAPKNVGQSFSSSYGSYSSAASYSMSHNSSLLNSSIPNVSNSANKENSFNGSYNYNASFNLSGTSLSDLSSSLIDSSALHLSSTIEMGNNGNKSKLYDRRLDASYLQPLKLSRSSPPGAIITENSLYSIVDSIQNGPPGSPMFHRPKPDSPPDHNLPFWIDPIWSEGSLQQKNELMNIKPTGAQNSNVLPIVLSPYTLSKIVNMKKVFNFESVDRKIT